MEITCGRGWGSSTWPPGNISLHQPGGKEGLNL